MLRPNGQTPAIAPLTHARRRQNSRRRRARLIATRGGSNALWVGQYEASRFVAWRILVCASAHTNRSHGTFWRRLSRVTYLVVGLLAPFADMAPFMRLDMHRGGFFR